MFTLNETIKLITDVADGHSQIASRGVGDLAEWNPSERTYPLLWVVPVDSDTEDARLNRTFRIGCFDRVIVGEEGQDNEGHEQEVLSDMEMVLLDFVAYFVQQDQQDFFTARIANLTPATEQMDDRLAGYFVDLTISQDWTFNKCQIPATVGSPSADVDGITLYDFCDDSVFDRLTQTQKDCLTATLCGVCEDATVVNASTPTWSYDISSGDTYRLPKGKMLDSDEITTVSANYIPEADGFMFTATPCGTPGLSVSVGLSDTTPTLGDSVTVTITSSGTPTAYVFYLPNADGGYTRISQAGNTYAWTVGVGGSVTVYGGASEAVATGFDIDGVAATVTGSRAAWVTGVNRGTFWNTFVIPRTDSFGNMQTTNNWGTADPIGAGNFGAVDFLNTSIMRFSGSGQFVGFTTAAGFGGITTFTGVYYESASSLKVYENGVFIATVMNPSTSPDGVIKVTRETSGVFKFWNDTTLLYTSTHTDTSDLYPYIRNGGGNRPLSRAHVTRVN